MNIPTEVQVFKINDELFVKGKLGIKKAKVGFCSINNNTILVEDLATKKTIKKMFQAVTVGFKGKLKFIGVGYKANLSTNALELFLGFKDPILVPFDNNIEVILKANGTIIEAKSTSLEHLTQFLSKIVHFRPSKKDIYKGKGVSWV